MRQIDNSSGQIIAYKRYDPFGNVLAQNGVGTSNYGYTGEWMDATGLEYLRARYYAPTQGRFTTRDVWEGDQNAPMSYNGWNYTNGNPVNLTDPSGKRVSLLPQLSQTLAAGLVPGSGMNLNLGTNNPLLSVLGECWWKNTPPAAVLVLAGLSANPWFEGYFAGMSGSVSEVTSGPWHMKIRGVDLVFDLKHQESAFFTYESVFAGTTTAIGVEASSYEGLIHGFNVDVSDYSGPFVTVSAGVSIPDVKFVSAGLSAFSSAPESSPCTPNFKMVGVVAYATVGAGVSLPIPASGSVSCTAYTMFQYGRWKYPKGIMGGLMIAYLILYAQPLDPIREYAAELALEYGVINQFGQP